MLSLDAIIQDGHHHALPGVASPPGPSDGERWQAACGAVPALLRSKGTLTSAGSGGGIWLQLSGFTGLFQARGSRMKVKTDSQATECCRALSRRGAAPELGQIGEGRRRWFWCWQSSPGGF